MKFIAAALLFFSLSLHAAQPRIQQIRMADGVALDTWVFKNPSRPRAPVVLERTPYTLINGMDHAGFAGTAEWAWSQGYHYIVQAVRGTGRSEGVFETFSPVNIEDARITLDWLDQQPFSDGKVAAMGTSYDGFTALAAGVTNHPTLKVVLAGGSPTHLLTDGFNSNGVLQLVFLDYLRYIESRQGVPFQEDFLKRAAEKLLLEADPLNYDRILFGIEVEEWRRVATHANHPGSPFWQTRSIFAQLPLIKVPTYHIAGMAVDGDLPDTLRNFRKTGPAKNHHLYLGYWNHGGSTPIGRDLEHLNSEMKERLPALLKHYLMGEPLPFADHQVMIASHFQPGLKSWPQVPFDHFSRRHLYVRASAGREILLGAAPPRAKPNHTNYWYRPAQIHGFTNDQHLTFFWRADEEVPVLGELQFQLSLTTEAPRMDLMIAVSKTGVGGEAQFVSNCLIAQRFELQVRPHKLRLTGDCPVFTKIEKDEVLNFYVTSNLFPQFTRVSTEPAGNLLEFRDYEIILDWDRSVPFVSIPVEPL